MMVNRKQSENEQSGPVIVTYDPSVIRKNKKSKEQIEREKKAYFAQKREMIGANTNQKLGLESSLDRENRLFKFIKDFDDGKFVSVEAAAQYYKMSYATMKQYAKETQLMLFDNRAGKWMDGRKPKYAPK